MAARNAKRAEKFVELTAQQGGVLSPNDGLPIGSVAAKVAGRLGVHASAAAAVAVSDAGVLPDAVVVAVIVAVIDSITRGVAALTEATVGLRLLIVPRRRVGAEEGAIEPFLVARVDQGGRIGVLGSAVPRIRRGEGSGLGPAGERVCPRRRVVTE